MGFLGKVVGSAVKAAANTAKQAAAASKSASSSSKPAGSGNMLKPIEKTVNSVKDAVSNMHFKKGGSASARGQGAVMKKKRPAKMS